MYLGSLVSKMQTSIHQIKQASIPLRETPLKKEFSIGNDK